jgi:Tfp pilus assembly protein PilO
MNKVSIIVIVVLTIGLIAASVFCFMLIQDKNDITTELRATQVELTSTNQTLAATMVELASMRQTLATTVTDLNTTKDTLTSINADLTATKNTLVTIQTELASTKQTLISKLVELDSANKKTTDAEKSLETVQQQLVEAQDILKGLDITLYASADCLDVKLVDNPEAQNPTWAELMDFLKNDHTENHEYIAGEYDCSQFSRDVHNHAEVAGIKAYEVQISFAGEEVGHALDAFVTTDYGLVYVDCTQPPDNIARIESDKEYRAFPVNSFSVINVRNDAWWDSLLTYYYMPGGNGKHLKVIHIRIYG